MWFTPPSPIKSDIVTLDRAVRGQHGGDHGQHGGDHGNQYTGGKHDIVTLATSNHRPTRNTQARAAAIAKQNILTFPGEVGRGRNRGSVTTSIPDAERGATNAAYLLSRVRRDAWSSVYL